MLADLRSVKGRGQRYAPAVVVLVMAAVLTGGTPANAATPAPGWRMDSIATPTNFFSSAPDTAECVAHLAQEQSPCDAYEVFATNAGSVPMDGSPVTLTDTLPAGVTPVSVSLAFFAGSGFSPGHPVPAGGCTKVPVQCTFPGSPEVIAPDDTLRMRVYVTVNNPEASGPLPPNTAAVSGGGAPSVSSEVSNQIGSTLAPFGVSRFDFFKDGLNGLEESQAGGHPYGLTTTIDLNNKLRNVPEGPVGKAGGWPASVEGVKDIVVDLPLGFAGSTLAAPQCTEAQLDSQAHCPPETIVGYLRTEPEETAGAHGPIWNIAPERGHPAEFGFIDALKGAHIAGYVSVVPTPAGYVLRFVSPDVPEILIDRIVVTFYGNPGERLDQTRLVCTYLENHNVGKYENATCTEPSPSGEGRYEYEPVPLAASPVPFFTNPTACSNGPQVAKIWTDSWQHPAHFQPGGLIPTNLEESAWKTGESVSPPVTGCNALQFTPQIGSQPTTHEADKPSGLDFEQRLPQSEIFGTNATPALKNTLITFPEGMTVDPSSANGLGVCTNAQIGWLGKAPAKPGELYDFTQAPPECPESSKIGTVELETPLIPGVLHGEVFLAAQNENPFDSTFATYIVVNDPVTGVVLKLAGELKSDPATGRLTAVFNETPQLPFSNLKVHFFGGPRAELATPPNCGTYTTNSELQPWSFPDSGLAATPFDSYVINENCATGFAPSFTGGSTNLQAGAFTTFVASFSREDNDQELAGLTVSLPPGLLANVGSVPQCGEAEIRAEEADRPGGCPAATQVGTVQAGAGPGPNPIFVPGKVFLTGPYNGGPYGLAVVVSANPGPFHFGNVVVRQSLRIDPHDAHVTDVSNPFPTFLDPVGANGQTNGIPIKLRRVDVSIDRPGFTFNPTNCSKLAVNATITSTQGAVSNHSVPFQVTNCATLKYTPTFTTTTAGKASKANGASLTFKIVYPNGAMGSQSWFNYAKFDIPKQLPARLTTIQKACLAATFEHDRSACPPASIIGHAIVHTPILGVPLEGPVYFVSYGGAAFPDAVLVLQGAGITIELHGKTFIEGKTRKTSATFENLPDTPFESIEVSIPQGPYSEFGSNLPKEGYDFCGQNLKMPVRFKASNGQEITQETPVSVTGCPPAVSISKMHVMGNSVLVTVTLGQGGTVKISGKGLKTVTKKGVKAGTHTITVPLTATGRAAKRHGGKLKVRAALTVSGRTGTATTSIKV
jgi:uncharacterized repeat protein (TIGR01451 family)